MNKFLSTTILKYPRILKKERLRLFNSLILTVLLHEFLRRIEKTCTAVNPLKNERGHEISNNNILTAFLNILKYCTGWNLSLQLETECVRFERKRHIEIFDPPPQ